MAEQVIAVVTAEANAEVEPRPEHWRECVALHPNEPCPGYPHDETED